VRERRILRLEKENKKRCWGETSGDPGRKGGKGGEGRQKARWKKTQLAKGEKKAETRGENNKSRVAGRGEKAPGGEKGKEVNEKTAEGATKKKKIGTTAMAASWGRLPEEKQLQGEFQEKELLKRRGWAPNDRFLGKEFDGKERVERIWEDGHTAIKRVRKKGKCSIGCPRSGRSGKIESVQKEAGVI